MNHYTDSKGNKVSKSTIDRLVRQCKERKLEQMQDEHGYIFCEECGTSNSRLDCSHTISVDQCQKNSSIDLELAWDVKNIRILCANCHSNYDKLDVRLQWRK